MEGLSVCDLGKGVLGWGRPVERGPGAYVRGSLART